MHRFLAGCIALASGPLPTMLLDQAMPALDEVVVTGSRIPTGDHEAARAGVLVLIDQSDLRRVGAESLGGALQQLPLNNGSPSNTNFNASQEDRGGDGSTRVDLRGLGPERTLVLVDGRRLAAGGLGGDTSVDLGMIPLSAVDRVEVLGAGNAAVYGTDAIGGVVNIITRRGGIGVGEAVLGGSLTSRSDGASAIAALTGGRKFPGGSVSGGIEWYGQQEVWMRDREYSRQREVLMDDGSAIAFGLAQTPQGYFRVPPSNTLGLPGGVFTRVTGSQDPTGPDDFRTFIEPDDRYNPNEDEYLRTPLDRWTVWFNGDYGEGTETRLGLSGLMHSRRSGQMLRPAPVDTRFGIGIPSLPIGRPGIPSSNLYNPFGVDMLDVRRRLVEAGRRRYEQDVDMVRLLATLEGASGAGWGWGGAIGWSRNETSQVTTGELRADRTAPALGPSGLDGDGRPVCGTPDPVTGRVSSTDVIAGCVPLDLFGGQGLDGRGTIDRRQLDYVTDRYLDHGRNEQWIADLGAHGRFDSALSAGPIGWATGVEYRHESAFNRPDPDKLAGVSGSVRGDFAEGGSYQATEVYGELRVPLMKDRPAALRLDLDAGLRWSHFSSFGDTVSGSARVAWQPDDGLTIRGGYSDVFRAPPLVDLYTSAIRFLSIARDPCGNNPDPVQRANCSANGVPGGSYLQEPLDQTPVTRGGNEDLRPESGSSWSIGVAWMPAAGSPELRVDYWHTVVNSAIRQLRDQTMLDQCADTGATAVCDRIERWSDGSLKEVDSRYLNVGTEAAGGVDLQVLHGVDTSAGLVNLRILATYLDERSITVSQGSEPIDVAGTKLERSLYPRWRGLAGFEFVRSAWSAGYLAEYIDGVRECNTGALLLPGMLDGCRQVASVLYHDLHLRYRAGGGWSAALFLDNVTDKDPPRVAFGLAEGNTSTVTYRLLGRTCSLQVTRTF